MKIWTEIPDVELHSDGGAEPNPGRGGFGVILSYKGIQKEFFKGYELTTNNRMELMGVIFGLEQLKTASNVQIFTDSKYVIDGITKGWAEKWKKNNWKRNKNKKALNSDLWDRLLNAMSEHNVEFTWVKGHAGHTENERCDTLANCGIHLKEVLTDTGYTPEENGSSVITNYTRNIGKTKKVKVEKEGDCCRKCGELVVKKNRKKTKKIKPNQTYYFEYVLLCPSCNTMYMTEDAKRHVIPTKETNNNNLFN